MRYLNYFNGTPIKESLLDDYEKYKTQHNATFLEALPTQAAKDEFMYRLSNEEDELSLISEFLDRFKLSDENDFHFRIDVLQNRVSELKKKYPQEVLLFAANLALTAKADGFDKTLEGVHDEINRRGVDPEQIVAMIQDALSYYEKYQEIANWAYQKELNPVKNEIAILNKFIDYLSDYYAN